jgi:dihydroneopterin aldolase
MTTDCIFIRGLELPVQIGVPDEERAEWQVLVADLTLTPKMGFQEMADDLSWTVDYEAVAKIVKKMVAERPRKLLEVLASEVVTHLLTNFPLVAVEIELRKRILPSVDHVAVRMRRVLS